MQRTEAPQTQEAIGRVKNEIWWAGARTFMLGLFKFRVFGYYFWTGVLMIVGAIAMTGLSVMGTPRLRDKLACPSRIPGYLVAWVWFLLAGINLLTAWGHAYIESLKDDDFHSFTFQQRAVGFSVKTLPTVTRLIFLWTGFILQMTVFQLLLAPECNGISMQLGISLICFIWLFVVVLGIIFKTKTFVNAYIYDPGSASEAQNLLTFLRQAAKSIGP